MKKKIYKLSTIVCLSLFLLGLTITAHASTESEVLVADGRALLFNSGNPTYSGIVDANVKFDAAVAADPTDQAANFFYAVTRVLVFALQQGGSSDLETLGDLFEAFGMTRNDNDSLDLGSPYNDPPEIYGHLNLPETTPDGESARAFLAGPFVTLIDAAIGNFNMITNTFNITLAADETGDEAIEVDDGDVLVLKSALYTLKSAILIMTAYDLNIDLRELVALGNAGVLQIQRDLLDKYQDLLTMRGDGATSLTNAKQALLNGIDAYRDGFNSIIGELDFQGDDLLFFELEEDINEANLLLTELTESQNSLIENRPAEFTDITETDTETIDFNHIFGNTGKSPFNIRAILPEFDQYNEPIPGTFPPIDDSSPVLNGIFPDLQTNDDLTRELELQPSGVVIIPERTINVQDGNLVDWADISPVFTDIIGDDNPDFEGADIQNLYLAKDDTYLYVRVTLADGPPNSNMKYSIRFAPQWSGDVDERCNGVFFDQDNSNWVVHVWEHFGEIVYGHHTTGFAQALENDIEWKVPLNEVGPIAGRFIRVWTSLNEPAYEPSDHNSPLIRIGPLASVSGTIDCPEYDGTGNILVWAFDGPDWRFARELGNAVADAQGNYTIEGLPIDSTVYLFALWDADGNGIRTIGDYVGMSGAVVVQSGGTTVDFGTDYEIQEASVSGLITCDNFEVGHGQIYIGVFDGSDPNSALLLGSALITAPGAYSISSLPSGTEAWVFAYWDANGSGSGGADFEDYTGSYINNPFVLSAGSNTDMDIDLIALYGKITGVVTDAYDQFISGLWVNAYDSSVGCWRSAQTGPDGSYTIIGLLPGSYRVQAGWNTDYLWEYYDNTRNQNEATLVDVVAGETTPDIDFVLDLGGKITGTVLRDSDNQPIAGLWVYANSNIGNGSAQTDSNGFYTIRGLPSGSYRVYVGTSGTDYAQEYYNNTYYSNSATFVDVAIEQTTSGIDFSLAIGGKITGIITRDSDGQPIEGLWVYANGNVSAQTDSNGFYTISGLLPGSYRVHVVTSGTDYAQEYYNNTYNSNSATLVDVEIEQITSGIDFGLAIGGKITGTVTRDSDGLPIAGLWVYANSNIGNGSAQTDSNGFYTISGLIPGSYRVYVATSGTDYAQEYYNNTYNSNSATIVEVEIEQTRSGIDFGLAISGKITGAVTRDSDGQPIEGLWVSANSNGNGSASQTDSNGFYTISGLIPGSYRVQVGTSGTDYAQEYYNNTYDSNSATLVDVVAGETTPDIDFVLDLGGKITGTVTRDSDGLPIAGLWVSANSNIGNGSAQTDSNGFYTISGLLPGSYRVYVGTSGTDYLEEYYDDIQDYSLATTVDVIIEQTRSGIDFGLAIGGKITGTVTRDSDGQPIEGLRVYANGNVSAQTDSNGFYTIRRLLPGSYRVHVATSGTDYAQEYYNNTYDYNSATLVDVEIEQTRSGIDFGLAIGGRITGTVLRDSDGQPIEGLYVYAYNYSTGSWVNYAWTQTDGSYTITRLPSGSYRVQVHTSGTYYLSEYYNNVPDSNSANPVDVTLGSTTPDINFALECDLSIDTDGDGTPDCLDAFPDDSNEWLDTDGDGIGNNADTDDDNDGMPDDWEIQYGLDPLINDANGDLDGDGVNNLKEYESGTDPTHKNGDVNGNSSVDLNDAILALQVMAGIEPSSTVHKEADVNGDEKIGLAEVIYILQKVSGLRE